MAETFCRVAAIKLNPLFHGGFDEWHSVCISLKISPDSRRFTIASQSFFKLLASKPKEKHYEKVTFTGPDSGYRIERSGRSRPLQKMRGLPRRRRRKTRPGQK
jgi:hypothetical protein